jgi:pimeloyl-ACP methyl ester carboxylesterase
MTEETIGRNTLTLDSHEISYLHAGEGSPVLLLHGTFWSRVWLPVIPKLAESNEVFAFDYPGFGRSAGRLDTEEATAPALARFVLRAAKASGIEGTFALAGHDIGGAVAQHVAVHGEGRVSRLALVNSVLYDSWPVPTLEQFRDNPEYARNIAPEELVEQRRQALHKATARELSEAEEEDYLSPWRTANGTRSWTAMAQAADARYTEELVEPLKEMGLPTLLLWGEEDEFQAIGYAQRFEREMPHAHLIAVAGARHIPMEDDPERTGSVLANFFAGNSA